MTSEPKASARDASFPVRSARLYKQAFEWADEDAIEACLSLTSAYNSQHAAIAKLGTSLGFTRTMGRQRVVRLLYFASQKRMTQFEIASEMQVTSSNITFLVDGLEKDGIVQRMPHPTDRRTIFVQLTDEGEQFAQIIVPSLARLMSRMMDGFDDSEKRSLSELLARLRSNAEAFDPKSLD